MPGVRAGWNEFVGDRCGLGGQRGWLGWQVGRGAVAEEGVWGSLRISARLCRAKWRRPTRSAWIIRALSDDCTLTFRREDGEGLGSGCWSRLRPWPGRESKPTPVLGQRAWPGPLPHPSPWAGSGRGPGWSS